MTRRQLHLNLFVYPGGHHEAAWRYDGSATDRILDIGFYQELARRAEAATFDGVFFADGPSLADNVRHASRFRLEPFTWLSAIAAVTRHIGLIATASTTYSEPYNLARLFASLDHLSAGRAGWNINVMPPWLPGGFDLFADEVVPILRSRGLFRTAYTGTTLRDHYGLPRPDSQYTAARPSLLQETS